MGLFVFTAIEFDLCNAPATFALAINLVLQLLNWKIALAFLDDVLILEESLQAHLANLLEVFERFQQIDLRIKRGLRWVINISKTGRRENFRIRELSPQLYSSLFRSRSPAVCHYNIRIPSVWTENKKNPFRI